MKKMPFFKHAALASALILACAGSAEAEWLKTYSTMALDTGFSVQSSQGGFYQSVFGNKQTKFSSLALIDELGVPKWRRKIATGGIDQFYTYELANGQLFINGTTRATDTGPSKPVWAKFNVNRATGQLTPVFRMAYDNNVQFFHAFEDPASHQIFGQASIKKSTSSYDIMVNQINPASGQPVWAKVFDFGAMDFASLIQPAGQNRYILAGETSTSADSTDSKIIIGFLDGQGAPIAGTFKKYGADGASNSGYLTPIGNGNYLLVGTTRITVVSPIGIPQTVSSAFVIKLNQNLQIVWKKAFKAANNANISASSAIPNNDGTFIISASYSPAFSFTDPFASFKQHPVTLKLAANGSLLNSKRYEFGDSDSGSFTASPGGGYLFQGTITNLSQQGGIQSINGVYGKFDAQLQAIWNRELIGTNSFYSSVAPTANGYWLTGISSSAQNASSDLLLGQLNINGDIPGCPEIEPITPSIVNAGITSATLTWSAKPATVKVNTAIPLNAHAITINNQPLALPTVNTLCN